MNLKKVILENVRIFDKKEIIFDGHQEIRLPNEAGKSTIADAITFALIGKLYSGSSDVASLKPIKNTKAPVTITVVYEEPGVTPREYTKILQENWVKTRGGSDFEMKGHNTTCFINGIKKTITEYEKEVCEHFNVPGTKELNIMLNPYYFSQNLTWQERLGYITKVTGKITHEDVYKRVPTTTVIDEELKKADYSVQATRSLLRLDLTQKKEKTEEIGTMIKGYNLEEKVKTTDYEEAKANLEKNNQEIMSLRLSIEGFKNPEIERLITEKYEIAADIQKSRELDNKELNRMNQNINDQIAEKQGNKEEINEKIVKANNELLMALNEIEQKNKRVTELESLISSKEVLLDKLRSEYDQEEMKEFKPEQSQHCPACNFNLTEEANKKALYDFNKKRSENLSNIIKAGLELKESIEIWTKEIADTKAQIATMKLDIVDKQQNRDNLINETQKLTTQIKNLMEARKYSYKSEETKNLEQKYETLIKSIEDEKSKPSETEKLTSRINDLRAENLLHNEIISTWNTQEQLKKLRREKEEELNKELKKLSNAEFKMDMLTLYTETYLGILTERLEHKFNGITFQLVEQNIKAGSWNEVCYVMVKTEQGLVPYETANTASKIKIGVKIANQLAENLKWSNLPMIIDNAEAITDNNRHYETKAQTISLIAWDLIKNQPQTAEQI